MTAKTHDDARVLLVLSRDYGELGLAMSLLRDQSFARHARMLLPPGTFAINRNALPVSASPWTTVDDITSACEEYRPDLVILLSGYLLPREGPLSPRSLEMLLGWLRDRGCRVITSDPYVGLASRLTIADVDLQWIPDVGSALTRWLVRWLMSPLERVLNPAGRISRVAGLEDLIHVYPTSVPISDDHTLQRSFFNPAIAYPANGGRALAAGRDHNDVLPGWLFIIAAVDLHVQRVLMGLPKFGELLLSMLQYAVKVNRHPTLLAPSALVELLGKALPDSVEVLSPCPFVEFERRLLDAEYVFYWNAFSFSQQARIANGLPFFALDRGHGSRIVKPYYDLARWCHYGGWEPAYLDQRKLPAPDELARLAALQQRAMRTMRERWQASPTPDELVTQLLR